MEAQPAVRPRSMSAQCCYIQSRQAFETNGCSNSLEFSPHPHNFEVPLSTLPAVAAAAYNCQNGYSTEELLDKTSLFWSRMSRAISYPLASLAFVSVKFN